MRNKFLVILASIFCLSSVSFAAETENFEDLVKRARELKGEGKYSQALTELSWATQQLEKLHLETLKGYFPNDVDGVKAGQAKMNNALGFMSIERPYVAANGAKMKASLLGSANSQGAAASGMGALAGFAQMAAAFDKNADAETVRIHGQRAQIVNQRGKLKLSLNLKSGMIFQIEQTSGKPTKEQFVAIANALEYEKLNGYLAAN